MRRRNAKRRVLKRRLRMGLERAERDGDNRTAGLLTAVLADKRLQNQLLDSINQRRKQRAFGDGSLIDILLSIDWNKLIDLLSRLFGL